MHLVTSSLLLVAQLNTLSLPAASLLLRLHFLNALALYVSRGRPPLPLADFYSNTAAAPAPPLATPTPATDALLPAHTPNPWLPLAQSALAHPDTHLCKTQRALMHYADMYGGAAPGCFAELEELDGAGALDGTLFVRVAGLTMDRLGWMREGGDQGKYDYSGFYAGVRA